MTIFFKFSKILWISDSHIHICKIFRNSITCSSSNLMLNTHINRTGSFFLQLYEPCISFMCVQDVRQWFILFKSNAQYTEVEPYINIFIYCGAFIKTWCGNSLRDDKIHLYCILIPKEKSTTWPFHFIKLAFPRGHPSEDSGYPADHVCHLNHGALGTIAFQWF